MTLPNQVNLFTIHGSKGLEFDKVYLLNYHLTTFGMLPTLNDFNIFKYMWYVGTSRSKNFLKIYKDTTKIIWPLTSDVDKSTYITNKKISFIKKIKFQKEFKQLRFSVTDFLEELKAEQLFFYENTFKFDVEELSIFKLRKNLIDYKNLSNFYGKFIEVVFEYYYIYFLDEIPDNNYFNRTVYQLNNTIIINYKYIETCKSLCKKLRIDFNTQIDLNLFERFKYKFNDDEIIFMTF